MLKIVLGNKNYSSWSLRSWLVLKQTGAPFEEIVIGLDQPDTAAQIARYTPSGRVPVLVDGDLTIWDSLAICEYLAEGHPDRGLWPADRRARAAARSVSAEMHSGFTNLRNDLPMDVRGRYPYAPPRAETQADIARIVAIWEACRSRSAAAGPFLFGPFCIADAIYAPVVTRFVTYGVPIAGRAREYMDAMVAHPPLREWIAAAQVEKLRVPRYERR